MDCELWCLSARDRLMLDACVWFADNRTSLRVTGRNCGVTKSSLHRFICGRLRGISYELYGCCRRRLKLNRYRR